MRAVVGSGASALGLVAALLAFVLCQGRPLPVATCCCGARGVGCGSGGTAVGRCWMAVRLSGLLRASLCACVRVVGHSLLVCVYCGCRGFVAGVLWWLGW